MKCCIKCKKHLPLTDYYRHSQMADGHLNKCKECTKHDVIKNRYAKLEYYRAYDRQRANLPHRVEARAEYQKTDSYKKSNYMSVRRNRIAYKDRSAARSMLQRAVISGKVVKTACFICGDSRVQGHHPDYSRPLDVIWLCVRHHTEAHRLCR